MVSFFCDEKDELNMHNSNYLDEEEPNVCPYVHIISFFFYYFPFLGGRDEREIETEKQQSGAEQRSKNQRTTNT